MTQPAIIIHGGIASFEGEHLTTAAYQQSLQRIIARAYDRLLAEDARAAVLDAVEQLEDDELFNAGTGSRLQADGEIRMSASLMDARTGIFSAVINLQAVEHPIAVAAHLASARHTMLAGEEATRYARALGMPHHSPFTAHRREEFVRKLAKRTGTVGAVAVDATGRLCAATSTGGVGWETPGRVGDSATVAGNYASPRAGISCTGIGEQLVNHAVAARIVTRVDDGASLEMAIAKTLVEAREQGHFYGLIGLAADGQCIASQTQGQVLYAAARSGHTIDFLSHPTA